MADNNAAYYYHFDGLGSVVALSDSNGDSCQSYEYSAYGQVAASDPNFIANPYMFTGRRFDIETGLYYYRARYYNPHIGRFMQTDAVGYSAGMNLYTYCVNNPLKFIDPSGLKADEKNIYCYFYDFRSVEFYKLFGDAWNSIELMAYFGFDERNEIEYRGKYGEGDEEANYLALNKETFDGSMIDWCNTPFSLVNEEKDGKLLMINDIPIIYEADDSWVRDTILGQYRGAIVTAVGIATGIGVNPYVGGAIAIGGIVLQIYDTVTFDAYKPLDGVTKIRLEFESALKRAKESGFPYTYYCHTCQKNNCGVHAP